MNHLDSKPPVKGPPAVARRRVFLVEDHPIFRRGLGQLINDEPGLIVCGEAGSAPEALSQIRALRPDAIVLDIGLAGANGIELIKQIRAEQGTLPILILSMHDEAVYGMRALRAGATGYLAKREGPEAVLEALHKVLQGEIHVSPQFGDKLIYKVIHEPEENGRTPLDRLTDRELEVLQLVGQGRSTTQIAQDLHLSAKTIESHRLHIKEKLGLAAASELVNFAREWVLGQNND